MERKIFEGNKDTFRDESKVSYTLCMMLNM